MNARLTRTAGRGNIGSILFALLPFVALAACRDVPTIQPPPPAPASAQPAAASTFTRTPSWVGEPLSWSKLDRIEAWLATDGTNADPFWRVEGEIALNQGRIDLARAEKSGQQANDTVMRTRLHASRAGFQRVLGDPDATPEQKKRVEAAIALCDRQLGAAPAETKPALLAIIPRSQWGAMPANTTHMDRNRGGWNRITVHHSAERVAPELNGTIGESAAAVRSIQKAHMEGKETGYGDIGYHFVIDPYGNIFQGRDLAWQGAHAGGSNNVQNIGVCLIGNFDEEKPTKAALDRLRRLIDNLRSTWKIPRSQVFTHQELKSTECPGKYLQRWVESYRRTSAAPVEATARSH
jgi:N-acetylmuramoyl-L-alanine amidase